MHSKGFSSKSALTPEKGKIYNLMLHWQKEFPAIIALLRHEFDGVTLPTRFSWLQNYKGSFWQTACSLADGMDMSLDQAIAAVQSTPRNLVDNFANKTGNEINEIVGDKIATDIENNLEETLSELVTLLGQLIAFTNIIECIAIHAKTLNQMIVWGRHNDYALLDAIRIDPTLVLHPHFKARIKQAHLLKHENFLIALNRALNPDNNSSRNINTNLNPLRLVVAMLGESGDINVKAAKVRQFIERDIGLDYYNGYNQESFRKEFYRVKKQYFRATLPERLVPESGKA